MSWLVEDGETGLVTPANDIDSLAEALCSCETTQICHSSGFEGSPEIPYITDY